MRHRPEDILQKAAAAWLDRQGWLWMHTPNERDMSARLGGHLNAMGVKSGVPDILIFEPCKDENGLWRCGIAIELKIGKPKPTENQRRWLAMLETRRWLAHVCVTRDEVKAACEPLNPITR